ncbi:Kinesin motor domain [Dillenia turbinata]|uniref:Kinesin-like protein n=1 Tax=Dillenia turbinata TaxID=194707 RepID=A0AAN8W5A4_9MAGN
MGAIGGEELARWEKVQGMGGREEKILVLVRLRPLSEKEIARNEVSDWECINESTILFRNSLQERSGLPTAYSFDRVFRGDCLTREVYEQGTKDIALAVVSGINSSIFAYGQTSSGKTYTMMGITEYTVADIYDYIQRHEERAFILRFSAMEIYNEHVRDLLSSDSSPLRLLDDPEKGTIVEKLTEEVLRDWNHLKQLLSICEAQRQVGETSLNETSSRSHQIIRLTIESSAREFLGKDNSTTLAASVNFVDLAGSERASQALSAGARLKEGCHINRSLLTLGTVIRKLSKGRHGHVNYRDSKLTRILQPCLGGNARTAIICTLSPARSHVEQSRNTLLFASCAKEVNTNARVNVVMSDKALVKHLQKELARLESELRAPAPTSNSEYTALLRKKDLQIEKVKIFMMEKEIGELTKQRDLAQFRVEDLLRMLGNVEASKGLEEKSSSLKWQEDVEDEYSESESVSRADPHSQAMGVGKLNEIQYLDSDGESNIEESNMQIQRNAEDHSMLNGTSSPSSARGTFVRCNPYWSQHELAHDNGEEADDLCKEVQCIEMGDANMEKNSKSLAAPSGENGSLGSVTRSSNEDLTDTRAGLSYGALEQKFRNLQKAVDSLNGPFPDESSQQDMTADMSSSQSLRLTRSWSAREKLMTCSPSPSLEKSGLHDETPPTGFEKDFPGKPEGTRRKWSPLDYNAHGGILSRNDSLSSIGTASVKTSADEDITSLHTFVAELQEMATLEYGKQLVEGQVQESDTKAGISGKIVKDVGVSPMEDQMENTPDWSSEFQRRQRALIELWQRCNVSLVHRTYFFLLFKGERSDAMYMEVEFRRLTFLKDSYSYENQCSSLKVLHRERVKLSKLMQKRLSEEERTKLYKKWGIALNSKRRKLQLAYKLWSESNNVNHIIESATIVAKLIRFLEQGKALKEMFGLSFTPRCPSRRILGWKNSMSSVL